MKKSLILATVLITAFACAVTVCAEGEGAVKVEFDPGVGWVVLNTTASRTLTATAHLDNGLPNENFMINVRVRYQDGRVDEHVNIATLSTNGEGKGNVEVRVDIDPLAGSNTLRRVAFRVRRPGPPSILYLAVARDIPLK